MTRPSAFISLTEAARQVRAKQTTPAELVEACLKQIDEWEPKVKAWVVVDRSAARHAADLAGAQLDRGEVRGPLHGVPVGIKDIIDVAGFPTLAGGRIRANAPATKDAFIVEKLRSAGAIILGKTVTTEFASFDPPPTRNPWNVARTPGGSSSGSAAGVATGMCFAALGSQTGGSIVRPASYCGVCGLKPTWGRVSLSGIVPLAYHLDHPGPIARSVGDLELMYRTIVGHDVSDPISQPRPDADFNEIATRQMPRIGVVGGFFRDRADADVRAAADGAIEQLRTAGIVVEPVELPPSFADVVRSHRLVMAVEAATYHRENFPARRAEYGPRIASLMDEGLAATITDYSRALELQLRFRRDMEQFLAAGKFNALAMPAVSNVAPPADTTGEPTFQAVWSFSGLPVVSMPCGLGNEGLPAALQFVGQAWQELPLLKTAAKCEAAIGFDERPQQR